MSCVRTIWEFGGSDQASAGMCCDRCQWRSRRVARRCRECESARNLSARVWRQDRRVSVQGRPGPYCLLVYRVKKGAIAVLERNVGRPNGVVEIAGASDFVGLGVLEKYCESARAVQDSVVSSLSHDEFINLSERNPTLKKKQAEAIDRELEHTKTLLSRSHQSTPAECLASFLVAVSYLNSHEGRDLAVIPDSLKCGTVASLMNIDVDTLALALVELKT